MNGQKMKMSDQKRKNQWTNQIRAKTIVVIVNNSWLP